MANVTANGIQIEYDTFGDPSSSPIILIMGLASQMIMWEEEFCEQLAGRGFYVVRFDNRDVGLTSKIEEIDMRKVLKTIGAALRGEKVESPSYTLEDMADDTVGLMDALGIKKAHVCGASMGGMIAQTMAIKYPSRLMSLISIMSTTGNPDLPARNPEVLKVMLTPWPEERQANIEHGMNVWRTIAGTGFEFDEDRVRDMITRSFDRCFYPQGSARQFLAIITQKNRKPALASVKIPTLVIHGDHDPLVPIEGGKDTAEAVPGAKMLIIEKMGHHIPRQVWPRIIDAIREHAEKAEK